MSEKKLKRIEINEKVGPIRGRISRTGGITGAVSPVKGVTLNTKHGARVSKTYKGLTLGLQNFNSVVRGRWSNKDEKVNVNLSKSGFSASVKNSLGTFNLKNPNRSSATFAGIQVRGKNAAWIAGFGFILDLAVMLMRLAFFIAYRVLFILAWAAVVAWDLSKFLGSWMLFLVIDLPQQLRKK
jgi:hypothetical protein